MRTSKGVQSSQLRLNRILPKRGTLRLVVGDGRHDHPGGADVDPVALGVEADRRAEGAGDRRGRDHRAAGDGEGRVRQRHPLAVARRGGRAGVHGQNVRAAPDHDRAAARVEAGLRAGRVGDRAQRQVRAAGSRHRGDVGRYPLPVDADRRRRRERERQRGDQRGGGGHDQEARARNGVRQAWVHGGSRVRSPGTARR
jgi:hypothetical protein